MGFKSVLNAAAYGVSASVLAFGMAANANALGINCYDTPAKVASMKEQMVAEGLAPVIKFYQDRSDIDSTKPKWEETIIAMNPRTGNGHRITKGSDGVFCVISNMSAMQLFDNAKAEPDLAAYIPTKEASAKETGINRFVIASAMTDKQLPMLKAVEQFPVLKQEGVTYILATGTSGKGTILRSTLQGTFIESSLKIIPDTTSAGVKHGAIFTEVGKDILSQRVAGLSPDRTLALKQP